MVDNLRFRVVSQSLPTSWSPRPVASAPCPDRPPTAGSSSVGSGFLLLAEKCWTICYNVNIWLHTSDDCIQVVTADKWCIHVIIAFKWWLHISDDCIYKWCIHVMTAFKWWLHISDDCIYKWCIHLMTACKWWLHTSDDCIQVMTAYKWCIHVMIAFQVMIAY